MRTERIVFFTEKFEPYITLQAGILDNRQFLEVDLLDNPYVWVPSEWVSVSTKDRLCAYAEQHYLKIGSIFQEGKTYVGTSMVV